MVVLLVGAVLSSGVLGALATGWMQHRKTRAETGSIVVKSAETVVAMQSTQIKSLSDQVQSIAARLTVVEGELSRERRETQRLRRWIGLLLDQIRTLGVEPVAEPAE